MTITLPHRGAGTRYVPRPTTRPMRRPALLARIATVNGARYAIGPRVDVRRIATALGTLAMIAVALVALGAAGTSDMRRACADVVTGSEDVTGAATCRDRFGPRGY